MMKKHVFLSHASDDKNPYVYPFASLLRKEGITCWLDDAEIKWGDKIAIKINDGIARSDFVIVFLTEAFIGRNWTETELSAALTRENTEGRALVLPIIVGDPKVLLINYPLLRDKMYLRWEDGVDILVDKLKSLVFPSAEHDHKIETNNHTETESDIPQNQSTKMNIGLVVNAHGKMCLVHDQQFEATPIWIGYHTDKKQLEIFFDTGSTFPINWTATDEMLEYFLRINNILVIRMENKKPVEGYQKSFIRLTGGKLIDDTPEAKSLYSDEGAKSIKKFIGVDAWLSECVGEVTVSNWETEAKWLSADDTFFSGLLKAFENSGMQLPFSLDCHMVSYSQLSFLDDAYIVSMKNAVEPNRLFGIVRLNDQAVLLDWTNKPIYTANELFGLRIDENKAIDYVKFFFHFVRGQLGRFVIAEKIENIHWLPSAKSAEVNEVAKYLRLLERCSEQAESSLVVLYGTVVFKNALFATKINIALESFEMFNPEMGATECFTFGQIKMSDEETVIDDLTVSIDPPPSSFYG